MDDTRLKHFTFVAMDDDSSMAVPYLACDISIGISPNLIDLFRVMGVRHKIYHGAYQFEPQRHLQPHSKSSDSSAFKVHQCFVLDEILYVEFERKNQCLGIDCELDIVNGDWGSMLRVILDDASQPGPSKDKHCQQRGSQQAYSQERKTLAKTLELKLESQGIVKDPDIPSLRFNGSFIKPVAVELYQAALREMIAIKDNTESLRLMLAAAVAGHPEAMLITGKHLFLGSSDEIVQKLGIEWLMTASSQLIFEALMFMVEFDAKGLYGFSDKESALDRLNIIKKLPDIPDYQKQAAQKFIDAHKLETQIEH
jgi:hypothetical protein